MESRILRFMIRFYDSICETLLTIQGRIPILITMHQGHGDRTHTPIEGVFGEGLPLG